MSWITVDTKLPDHPKMAALPSDTARWGWLVTLLEAKEQRVPGTFAGERHYRHVMVRHGRFLPDYLKVGLMDRDEDGTLHVHDWKRHQWAAAKAQQRGTSEGHSEDKDETSDGQKEDASRAVLVPVYVSSESTEGGAGGNRADDRDSQDRYHELTGFRPWGQWSGKTLLGAERDYGKAGVIAALDAEQAAGADRDNLLKRTLARLARDTEKARQAKADTPRPRIVRDEAAFQAERQRLSKPGATA